MIMMPMLRLVCKVLDICRSGRHKRRQEWFKVSGLNIKTMVKSTLS